MIQYIDVIMVAKVLLKKMFAIVLVDTAFVDLY